MPKLTYTEEIKQLKDKLKVSEALAEERGQLVAKLNSYIAALHKTDSLNKDMFLKQRKDFSKLALAYDTVRQVIMRTSAALNLDEINPLTITKLRSSVYNEPSVQVQTPIREAAK